MTQTSLFDLPTPPLTLPYQGRTVAARVAPGLAAADHAAQRRGRLSARYLDALLARGAEGLTDHEAAHALGCPVSSICSTRAGHQIEPQICALGWRTGPYRERNTVYVLRIAVGRRFDQEATC